MVCSMMKKVVTGALLGAGALALVFGTAAPSYVKTAFHKVRTGAKDAVPIQFEIERARQMITDLDPAIKSNIETLAKYDVEIGHLKKEIVATHENLNKEKSTILALREALTKDVRPASNGVTYSKEDVTRELASRYDHYKRTQETLTAREKTLEARQKAYASAQAQLDTMHVKKQELLSRLDQIEAQLKSVEATQTANDLSIDDSALSQVKQTILDLEKRLEVVTKQSELEGRYTERTTPSVIVPNRDVVKEIDTEFGKTDKTGAEKSL